MDRRHRGKADLPTLSSRPQHRRGQGAHRAEHPEGSPARTAGPQPARVNPTAADPFAREGLDPDALANGDHAASTDRDPLAVALQIHPDVFARSDDDVLVEDG